MASMAMESTSMPGGATLSSPLPSPAHPRTSPRTISHTANTAPSEIPLRQSTPPIGSGITSMLRTIEQGGQKYGEASCGKVQPADDAHVEQQITSDARVEQRDGSEVPISTTVGGKRSLSHASESSRARKAAKSISSKAVMSKLQNPKTAGRKLPPIIKIMVKEMKNKFHKYFMESYLTNCIPVILDPRFKMELVELRLETYFGVDAPKHIQEVRTAINALFREYATELEVDVNLASQEERNEEGVSLADDLSDWDDHVKLKKARSRNELQRYLEDDFHPRTTEFDILKWWDANSARYPTLGRIARDVLAIPASSVAPESAFSTCGRVITDHRSSLAPETVEALMCYGDWIKPDSSSEGSTSHSFDS